MGAPRGRIAVIEHRWNGRSAEQLRHDAPACFASSGLGDSIAQPRLPLFAQTVAPDPTPRAQDAFHRHAWNHNDMPNAGAASVYMRRPGASTVSITATVATPAPRGSWHIDIDYTPTPREPITATPRDATPAPAAPPTHG